MKRLIAAVLLASLSACSLSTVKSPTLKLEASTRIVSVDCTTSRRAPAIDSVMTVVMLVTTAVVAGIAVKDDSKGEGAVAAGFGLSGLIFAVSAGIGFTRTTACRVAKRGEAEIRARIAP
jgi:hypothetical protein